MSRKVKASVDGETTNYTELESTNGTRTYDEMNMDKYGTFVTLRDEKAKVTYTVYESMKFYTVLDWSNESTDPDDTNDDYDFKYDTVKGYYEIGSKDYYAEAMSYVVTNKKTGQTESVGTMIYCYNGKSYPDYVITKMQDPKNPDGGFVGVAEQQITSFQTTAPDKYMNFEKIIQDYQNKGFKDATNLNQDDLDDIYGDIDF